MYSIIYIVGYMLVVLLSCVSTSEYPFSVQKTVSFQYYFGYDKYYNYIHLDVTLKNIPRSVTDVTVIRNTYHYNDPGPYKEAVNVYVDKKTREAEFIILEVLIDYQIWFDVELCNRKGLCHLSQIIEGRFMFENTNGYYYWDTTQSKVMYYEYNTNYLNKYVSNGYCFVPDVCKMVVDLSEECEDKQVYTKNDLECNKGQSQYICTLVQDNMNYKNVVMYQMSQNNTLIEPILELKAGRTINLHFNFELFDNNTFVTLEATRLQETTTKSYKITVTDKDISKVNGDVKIHMYSDTKKYEFSCEEYNNTYSITEIYVGVINTTDNKIIKTVKDKVIIEEIKMENNGTMFCCMLYDVRESITYEKNITVTRYVKTKTLLIYQSHKSTTTNQPETDELMELPFFSSNWWIFLISVMGVTFLILIIYLIIKRYWHKSRTNSRSAGGTAELNENANSNQVLYAKLEFGRNENQTANKTEETEYATIVGVVQPFGNGRA